MPEGPADTEIKALLGKELVDRVQQPIGRVGRVYLDERTGQPSWVTVRTGWFGLRESFVPLAGAEITGDQIRVPYDKALIKDAPHPDTEEPLSFAEQDHLFRHYDVDLDVDLDVVVDADSGGGCPLAAAPRDGGPADRPPLRKYVVIETQTATVPVTREVPVIDPDHRHQLRPVPGRRPDR